MYLIRYKWSIVVTAASDFSEHVGGKVETLNTLQQHKYSHIFCVLKTDSKPGGGLVFIVQSLRQVSGAHLCLEHHGNLEEAFEHFPLELLYIDTFFYGYYTCLITASCCRIFFSSVISCLCGTRVCVAPTCVNCEEEEEEGEVGGRRV